MKSAQAVESEIKRGQIRWRHGLIVAVAMMLIALIPQIYFIVNRGHQWNGANALTHPDEVAYSAYTASLIRGSPRRNDPFTGRSETPESLFSIQFAPAYTIAAPAKILGLSASTVFIILAPICAFFASLALFWLFALITRDDRFSAAAVAIVFGFGTVIAGQGIVRYVLKLDYLIPMWIFTRVSPAGVYGLPFLRLYQPAPAFPLFLVLCSLVWLALTRTGKRAVIAAAAAGAVFVVLVFSYFYLWTAAAAWLSSLFAMMLLTRRTERRRIVSVMLIVAAFAGIALVPYFRLLSQRAETIDAVQALTFTHRPDLFRLPEIVAALVIVWIIFRVRRRQAQWSDPAYLIAISFALTVLVVFNQQVLSGRSLQPIHYQWFIANYCALIALIITTAMSWRNHALAAKRLRILSLVAVLWAGGEMCLTASLAWDYNRSIDEAKPVANRLAQIGQPNQLVLMSNLRLADRLPTDAPLPVLWAPRMLVFPGVSEIENRERFRRQLYYLGYNEKKFWAELERSGWYFLAGLFPYQRLSPAVSGGSVQITPEELRAQLRTYLDYARTFNHERAASPELSFVVVRVDDQNDLQNLDRWYQRDEGEHLGDFILYRVKLR